MKLPKSCTSVIGVNMNYILNVGLCFLEFCPKLKFINLFFMFWQV